VEILTTVVGAQERVVATRAELVVPGKAVRVPPCSFILKRSTAWAREGYRERAIERSSERIVGDWVKRNRLSRLVQQEESKPRRFASW
jgi:hypothetical protein